MTDIVQSGPWRSNFKIDGVAGAPVKLHQIASKTFILQSDIRYDGETGLEGKIDAATLEDIRLMQKGTETDLASVPGPLRWFLGTYGRHTPAVLIHDRLIPTPEELQGKMTDQYADRYLRFMAKDVGVLWLKRWIMWAGVAVRTRWMGAWNRKLSLVLWFVAAGLGMFTFAHATADWDVGWMSLAILWMFVSAGLWGGQCGAGVIAGIAAPWLLPPTVLAIAGYVVYLVLEFVSGQVLKALGKQEVRGTGSYRAEGF
jgi:hypothetical protein